MRIVGEFRFHVDRQRHSLAPMTYSDVARPLISLVKNTPHLIISNSKYKVPLSSIYDDDVSSQIKIVQDSV